MLKYTVKKVIGIFEWLLTIVLVSVVLLLIFTAFDPVKSFRVLRVMSGSMEPAIKVGSVVFVQKVNTETLKVSDIITFASTDDPTIAITHRLAAIEEKEGKTVFKTKGDANNIEDTAEISSSQIKGKVLFSLPYLGYVSVWIKQPLGFALLVILPAILIILSEIFNIKKSIEKEVEKKISMHSLLILCLLGISLFQIKTTNAYFSDVAVIIGNTFSTGVWETPTPTPTAGATPAPTPTPTTEVTPTPTPASPSPGGPACPPGTIIQQNFLDVHTTVTSEASTGNNTIDGNTGGSTNVTTGDASASATVITTGGSNIIHCIQNNSSNP